MILAGRFAEYVESIIRMHNEEQEDKTIWEMWLHKVYDKSYNDFRQSLGMIEGKAAPTQEETAEVIRQSFDMLKGFQLTGAGENGAIQAAGDNSG